MPAIRRKPKSFASSVVKCGGIYSIAIRPKPKKGGRVSSDAEDISESVMQRGILLRCTSSDEQCSVDKVVDKKYQIQRSTSMLPPGKYKYVYVTEGEDTGVRKSNKAQGFSVALMLRWTCVGAKRI